MRSEEWSRVEELLDAALELEPAERRRFLDAAAEPGLRREVEALLACEAQADGFLDAPAIALSADFFGGEPAEGARAGQTVGRYRILREVGRGGMGAVFLAERADGEFEQRVALKVIRRSLADTDLARRFRRERQILATLNHEHVARLLDGGVSEEGEPFFVMEYVEGSRVDDYCEARGLSSRERLRLFLKVCDAVAYAHQRLVVHRDIKPSNVLVTADGAPKLLDFGIAKLLDPERAGDETRTEHRAFTPEYASPEQARGESVTTVSDVYSLGVLLRNLLQGAGAPGGRGGRRPEGWRAEGGAGGRTAAANLPTRPEGVGAETAREPFGAELRNIVLMATREEPARRYQSVAQLAEDVRRHLDGLPVRAQPDSLTYRASKFVRRNRVAVTAAALVVAALVAGLALALWQADVARRERDRAESRFNDVRRLSNALLTDIAPKFERLEGATEARQALVAQSLKYLDSLAGESADDLVLQAELAAAYEKVGVLQGDSRKPSLSDFRGAIASLEKAQQIRRRLLGSHPGDAQNRRLLADNLRLLAIRRLAQNEAEGGLRDSKEALQIYGALVAERPDSLELRRASLETRVEDATNFVNLARFAEAIPPLRQTAEHLDELRQTHPGDTDAERILAKCLAALGLALSWETRQPEAEAEMTRAVAIAESLVARFPNDTNLKQELWRTYESASAIYEEINDARGFELSEKARRVAEGIIAADPANAQARHNLAKSFSRLGISASNLGKPAEALGLLERAREIIVGLQARDPLNRGYDRDLSGLYLRIGVARRTSRDFTGALAAYERCAAIFEKQLAEDPGNTIALRDVAIAYRHVGITHKELAKTDNRQTRQTHLAAERESYQRGVNALLEAEAHNALPEVSRKLIDEWRKEIEELDKMR